MGVGGIDRRKDLLMRKLNKHFWQYLMNNYDRIVRNEESQDYAIFVRESIKPPKNNPE